MTDLYDRLFPQFDGTPRIAVHFFRAALSDYGEGKMTRAEVVAAFVLDASAQVDLDKMLHQIDVIKASHPDPLLHLSRWFQNLEGVCMLVEAKVKYTTKAAFKTRLGLT